jgi:hypothetical protein
MERFPYLYTLLISDAQIAANLCTPRKGDCNAKIINISKDRGILNEMDVINITLGKNLRYVDINPESYLNSNISGFANILQITKKINPNDQFPKSCKFPMFQVVSNAYQIIGIVEQYVRDIKSAKNLKLLKSIL